MPAKGIAKRRRSSSPEENLVGEVRTRRGEVPRGRRSNYLLPLPPHPVIAQLYYT